MTCCDRVKVSAGADFFFQVVISEHNDACSEAVPIGPIDEESVVALVMFDSVGIETATITTTRFSPAADWTVPLITATIPAAETEKLTIGKTAQVEIVISQPSGAPEIRLIIQGYDIIKSRVVLP